MSTNAIPTWLMKLQKVWDRRETAGFYEIEEIVSQALSQAHKEGREEVIREIRVMGDVSKTGLFIDKKDWQEYSEECICQRLTDSRGKQSWIAVNKFCPIHSQHKKVRGK